MTLWNLVNPGYGPIALNEGVGSPASIAPGLTFWTDPALVSSVTLNGGDVAALADISGQLRDAVQGTAGQQPLYATGGSGINGRSVVAYTGANNDVLALNNSLAIARNKPGVSFVMITRIPTLGSAQRVLTIATTGGLVLFGVTVAGTGTITVSSRRLAADSASNLSSTATVTAAQAAYVACTVDYATGEVVIDVDGTTRSQTAAWTAGAANQDADHPSAPTLGRNAANTLTGDVGECCFWPRALTAAEITNLRNSYFKPKWGTP